MLFRCLYPMELDTGPWTRKSSILCSLLLLFVTFFVLGVPGHAENAKLGDHLPKKGEVKLNINYFIGVKKKFNITEYKEFSAGDCNVQFKDGFVEFKDEGKLCAVEMNSEFCFHANDYRLLAAINPPKTTIQTTTTTTTKEAPPTEKCPECPKTECPTTKATTTTPPTEKKCEESGSGGGLVIGIIVGFLVGGLCVGGIGALIWFSMKKKDKENQKDNEKSSAKGLPSKKIDGTAANKKKTPKAGADGKKASNAVSDMAKNVEEPKAEGASPSQYEEEG